MLLWNIIEFVHMALGLRPEVFNSIDVILLVCKQFRMIDAEVF